MTILLMLLTLHFVADFVLQSDRMAVGKSHSWRCLLAHVGAYAGCFALLAVGVLPIRAWAPFVALIFMPHFVQDAITSRINARLWQANQRHWFFVGIGFDQLLHAYALAWAWTLVSH